MYKININSSILLLIHKKELLKYKESNTGSLIVRYRGKKARLLNYIDLLEKTKKKKTIVITAENFDNLKSDFKSLYKIIKAAGGLVMNDSGECLFIYRRGLWDLPKGKIEIGEKKRAAALREVEEETGVKSLSIVKKLEKTRHTYISKKGTRVLKINHWFSMTTHKQPLIPQFEEDIEQAVWMTMSDFNQQGLEIYTSLIPLINHL